MSSWLAVRHTNVSRLMQSNLFAVAADPLLRWSPPASLPDLSGETLLGFDTETYDPELLTHGPGWARNSGRMLGFSIATKEKAWYFPVAHDAQWDNTEKSYTPEQALDWLRALLLRSDLTLVGANVVYDLGWVVSKAEQIKCEFWDVSYAAAILSETASVSLAAIAEFYKLSGKDTGDLYQWCANQYGGKPDGKQRANIYRAPVELVGKYAEQDAALPLQIQGKQKFNIRTQSLERVLSLELLCIPLLVEMRHNGVRVDLQAAQQLLTDLATQEQQLRDTYSCRDLNVHQRSALVAFFDRHNMPLPVANGKTSFSQEALQNRSEEVCQAILQIRQLQKVGTTFVQNGLLDCVAAERIHTTFHPLRSETYGTRTGRYSSAQPNLQNLPARDVEISNRVRGLFIPEPGEQWVSIDYAQIEFRLLLHFATGPGAQAARDQINKDPDLDFHNLVLGLVAPAAGWDIGNPEGFKKYRKQIKTINFGLLYGLGKKALAKQLNLSLSGSEELVKLYHKRLPFIKATTQKYAHKALTDGFVRTLAGRINSFDMWEPVHGQGKPLPRKAAQEAYGNQIRRAFAYRALNRVLQGSAADVFKQALWQGHEQGLFKELGVPLILVHDELNLSVNLSDAGKRQALQQLCKLLETVATLRVPLRVSMSTGKDWGHIEELQRKATPDVATDDSIF